MARKRSVPKDTYRLQIDARIPFVEIANALWTIGVAIRLNPESNDMYAVKAEKSALGPASVVKLGAKE